jgi:hypothetical protein
MLAHFTAMHYTCHTYAMLYKQAFTPGDAVQSSAAPALLGEVVLATKDSNRRTREAAVCLLNVFKLLLLQAIEL